MAQSIMNAGKDSTIQIFINSYSIDTMTFKKMYMQEVMEFNSGRKIIVNSESLIDRYVNELADYKMKLSMTDEEKRKYRFNPKSLSFDLYGTTELWNLLLHANEMFSVAEFETMDDDVYVYSGSVLQFINKVIDLEKNYVDYNESLNQKILDK